MVQFEAHRMIFSENHPAIFYAKKLQFDPVHREQGISTFLEKLADNHCKMVMVFFNSVLIDGEQTNFSSLASLTSRSLSYDEQ